MNSAVGVLILKAPSALFMGNSKNFKCPVRPRRNNLGPRKRRSRGRKLEVKMDIGKIRAGRASATDFKTFKSFCNLAAREWLDILRAGSDVFDFAFEQFLLEAGRGGYRFSDFGCSVENMQELWVANRDRLAKIYVGRMRKGEDKEFDFPTHIIHLYKNDLTGNNFFQQIGTSWKELAVAWNASCVRNAADLFHKAKIEPWRDHGCLFRGLDYLMKTFFIDVSQTGMDEEEILSLFSKISTYGLEQKINDIRTKEEKEKETGKSSFYYPLNSIIDMILRGGVIPVSRFLTYEELKRWTKHNEKIGLVNQFSYLKLLEKNGSVGKQETYPFFALLDRCQLPSEELEKLGIDSSSVLLFSSLAKS